MPENSATVDDVLKAVSEQVGCANLGYASRMNRAVVVFLKKEILVSKVNASGVWVKRVMKPVSPLFAPSTRVVVSNVPRFNKKESLMSKLSCFGKFTSGVKSIALWCKDPGLKHVLSFRRQGFMYLNSPAQTLSMSFRVKFGDGSYIVYASMDSLRAYGQNQSTVDANREKTAEQQTGRGGVEGSGVRIVGSREEAGAGGNGGGGWDGGASRW